MEDFDKARSALDDILQAQAALEEKRVALLEEGQSLAERLSQAREALASHHLVRLFGHTKEFLSLFRDGPVARCYVQLMEDLAGLDANVEDFVKAINSAQVPPGEEAARSLAASLRPGTPLPGFLKKLAEVGPKNNLL